MVNSANSLSKNLQSIWSSLVLAALYLPVLFLVIYGFNSGSFALRWEGFSMRWYLTALSDGELLGALLNSLFIAMISTLLAVCLGLLYALWAHRAQRKTLAGATDTLISLPLFIPEIVIAIGLLIMIIKVLKPASMSVGLNIDSIMSIILGHTTLALGYASLVLRTRFKNYDLQQELAAKDLGADRWSIFQHVMLPQILPGLAAASCISFAISLDDFYVSYFLSTGGSSLQTLPLYIWSLQGRRAMTPEINVVSSLLLVLALLFFGLGLTLSRSERHSRATAKD